MRFCVSEKTENELSLLLISDTKTGTSVSILPGYGALLHTYSLLKNGKAFNCIDHYKSLAELKEILNRSYKSSKLSPFVCRIASGKYEFDGKRYEFADKFPDGTAIHGLLYNKPFSLVKKTDGEKSAFAVLSYEYDSDDPAYPFRYRCEVSYELKENNYLEVETTVTNTGQNTLPLADGWHPYFTLGGKSDEWTLHLAAANMLEFNEKLIPTGKMLPNSFFREPALLGDLFLDNCFVTDASGDEPVCELKNERNGLALELFALSNYPYLQVYTPPHRESIAIEHLSAAPDCFNNGIGLTILRPGNSQSFALAYRLSAV